MAASICRCCGPCYRRRSGPEVASSCGGPEELWGCRVKSPRLATSAISLGGTTHGGRVISPTHLILSLVGGRNISRCPSPIGIQTTRPTSLLHAAFLSSCRLRPGDTKDQIIVRARAVLCSLPCRRAWRVQACFGPAMKVDVVVGPSLLSAKKFKKQVAILNEQGGRHVNPRELALHGSPKQHQSI